MRVNSHSGHLSYTQLVEESSQVSNSTTNNTKTKQSNWGIWKARFQGENFGFMQRKVLFGYAICSYPSALIRGFLGKGVLANSFHPKEMDIQTQNISYEPINDEARIQHLDDN